MIRLQIKKEQANYPNETYAGLFFQSSITSIFGA